MLSYDKMENSALAAFVGSALANVLHTFVKSGGTKNGCDYCSKSRRALCAERDRSTGRRRSRWALRARRRDGATSSNTLSLTNEVEEGLGKDLVDWIREDTYDPTPARAVNHSYSTKNSFWPCDVTDASLATFEVTFEPSRAFSAARRVDVQGILNVCPSLEPPRAILSLSKRVRARDEAVCSSTGWEAVMRPHCTSARRPAKLAAQAK